VEKPECIPTSRDAAIHKGIALRFSYKQA